ncbi:conserved hypothetical protein [Histoplasma capsulatum var. duboisii H88]|uniref:Uncharacterized protein n=2 Tax=Ajellomyces capsulatus TaxID=5037 RepID=F0U5I8_AJEC8|nr:conserved hypothetical protein [Histoplasma capsulatum H143]EGC42125.1 conserved hypothetical protein [Histoplasma capsulatum var. duboisii H88]
MEENTGRQEVAGVDKTDIDSPPGTDIEYMDLLGNSGDLCEISERRRRENMRCSGLKDSEKVDRALSKAERHETTQSPAENGDNPERTPVSARA